MQNIIEFLLRSVIGIIWVAALILTTILLAPVHVLLMLTTNIFQGTDLKSQWVW